MKVHLVDGTFELFRAYFGAPSSKTKDGREVGATRAFLRSMAALVREPGVTHVGIAFDTVIESFRNQLFAGYKTGEGMEPDLWAQFPLAEQAARALGLVTWSMGEAREALPSEGRSASARSPLADYETDDALATMAARAVKDEQVDEVLILSPDKDFAQCVVGTRVVTVDRIRKTKMDEARVREKFGVGPASIPDWLALVGDTADGIPGIARWGAKSASTVLARYEHLEQIPDDDAKWDVKVRGAAALAAALAAARQEALLYRTLATLRRDVPLPEDVSGLAYRGRDDAAVAALCASIEDRSFLART